MAPDVRQNAQNLLANSAKTLVSRPFACQNVWISNLSATKRFSTEPLLNQRSPVCGTKRHQNLLPFPPEMLGTDGPSNADYEWN